jgi:AraC-like DNA-binding protein
VPPAAATALLAERSRLAPGEVIRIVHGAGGAVTRIVCGFLNCDGELSNPLLASLPRLFKVGVGNDAESAWLASALNFGAAEAAFPRDGSATVLAKLSELLFVQAIRRCIDSLPPGQKGWLGALRDRYVGRALVSMHADPAHPWTVDELARQAGLSRSALAQRFSELLGQPPMQYLAQWRLHAAARELRNGGKTLAKIAGAAGYESEPAFSRAFKRQFGLPPASWRNQQH